MLEAVFNDAAGDSFEVSNLVGFEPMKKSPEPFDETDLVFSVEHVRIGQFQEDPFICFNHGRESATQEGEIEDPDVSSTSNI